MISADNIRRIAFETGFSLCGIARSAPMPVHGERLAGWLSRGFHSGMEYMERNGDKRADPGLLMPGARTVVVCAVSYKNGAWDQPSDRENKIASYAYARDYHSTIKSMLSTVRDRLSEIYPGIGSRCFVDTAPILEKAWAVEAGLGCAGKNSLLITPGFGSFVLLGELILDTAVDNYDLRFGEDLCEGCGKCVNACPNGAIRAGRVIDTGRCISRMTIEKTGEGAEQSWAELHGWIFGCDICQSVCPYNALSPERTLPAFAPVISPEATAVPGFWENLSEEGFNAIFGETPLSRTGFRTLKQRACSK